MTDERFFFFPGLVSLNKPQDITPANQMVTATVHGWVFQCSKLEQFFSNQFHQVLLIRLTFSFALAPSADALVLQRRCQVWKNGICWANTSGGEAIVEIIGFIKVVVIVRSKKKIELSRLRSSIINMVINAKKEFSSIVAVKESLLLPEDSFPNIDIDMATKFLCHLDFCQEIKDADLLSVLEAESRTLTVFAESKASAESGESKSSITTDERFFFFPGLVSLNKPQDIAFSRESDRHSYSGWVFQCSKPEQFYSNRFHQVLLLRLAFSFALAPSDQSSVNALVLQRRCQVWKNGICWANRSGGEAIVEIIDLKKVVVDQQSSTRLSTQRSSLVQKLQ